MYLRGRDGTIKQLKAVLKELNLPWSERYRAYSIRTNHIER